MKAIKVAGKPYGFEHVIPFYSHKASANMPFGSNFYSSFMEIRVPEYIEFLKLICPNEVPDETVNFLVDIAKMSNPACLKFFTNEQFAFAFTKAVVFGDFQSAEQSLEFNNNPTKCKAIGRKVKNYDNELWSKISFQVVAFGVYEKFRQNKSIRNALIASRDYAIVEASQNDSIWGVGLSENNADITDFAKWKGQNKLGRVLMLVRERLIREDELVKSMDIQLKQEFVTDLKNAENAFIET